MLLAVRFECLHADNNEEIEFEAQKRTPVQHGSIDCSREFFAEPGDTRKWRCGCYMIKGLKLIEPLETL